MFNKLKQLKELKDLQDSLSKEKAEVEKNGIKVVVNGKMEIEQIKLNPELAIDEQEKKLQECINDAMKKVQMAAAQKMSGLINL
jgi:DNA-binding protein YbaB